MVSVKTQGRCCDESRSIAICLNRPSFLPSPPYSTVQTYAVRSHSSLSGQPSFLHLGERPATAQEYQGANAQRHRQYLEQVPRSVIEEEQALHGDNRAVEQHVCDRCLTEGSGEVVGVCTNKEPLAPSVHVLQLSSGNVPRPVVPAEQRLLRP